ncbi:MAG: putative molybdenum carrier protein [Acidobacteriota bacterium]
MTIQKIVTGGQTGVDRAALDVCLELSIPCGGWSPKGRLAEDGRISDRYPLRETPSQVFAQRTEWNVRDSDGSLVLHRGKPAGGTAKTVEFAIKQRRPYLCIDLTQALDLNQIRSWLLSRRVSVLNIAGPRESEEPGIYAQARELLTRLLET